LLFDATPAPFEKPGGHSHLLLLLLDDINWQGNADSRRLVSGFRR
jgi:hypothetical protein